MVKCRAAEESRSRTRTTDEDEHDGGSLSLRHSLEQFLIWEGDGRNGFSVGENLLGEEAGDRGKDAEMVSALYRMKVNQRISTGPRQGPEG